jgi:hypothetical protein
MPYRVERADGFMYMVDSAVTHHGLLCCGGVDRQLPAHHFLHILINDKLIIHLLHY